jgi:hypothetical protein
VIFNENVNFKIEKKKFNNFKYEENESEEKFESEENDNLIQNNDEEEKDFEVNDFFSSIKINDEYLDFFNTKSKGIKYLNLNNQGYEILIYYEDENNKIKKEIKNYLKKRGFIVFTINKNFSKHIIKNSIDLILIITNDQIKTEEYFYTDYNLSSNNKIPKILITNNKEITNSFNTLSYTDLIYFPVDISEFFLKIESNIDNSMSTCLPFIKSIGLEMTNDESLLDELLNLFIETGKDQINDLNNLISKSNFSSAHEISVSLFNSSSQIACKPISRVCYLLQIIFSYFIKNKNIEEEGYKNNILKLNELMKILSVRFFDLENFVLKK